MKLLVVVVCYRVADLTIDCLRSLSGEVGRVPGTKVAVCENGTGPESAERIAEAIAENCWGDWAELTVIYPNRGFTGGNNHIIRQAMAWADPPEYVLLLNADTIVQEHALVALVAFMDAHPRVGIAGSQLLSLEGDIQASQFRFEGVFSEFDRGIRLGVVTKLLANWTVVIPTPSTNARVDWVSGASMIIRRAVLDEIGLLDEGLYTYYDDIDICLRARRAGWESWYVPSSRVVHLVAASTGLASKVPKRWPSYWFQARRRFFLKSYGPVRAAMADAAFLTGFALWRVRRWIQRKPDTDPPHMLADSFRHSVFRTGFKVTEVPNPALTTT